MIEPVSDGVVLSVRVIPRASTSRIDGTRAGALLVRLQAAPVDGAANAALVALLAKACGVPRRQVTIVAGETSRDKRVHVRGVDAARVAAAIGTV